MEEVAMKKSAAPWLLIGGGLAGLSAILLAVKKSGDTTTAVEKAVAGQNPDVDKPTPMASGSYPKISARLTGYWPFQAGLDKAARLMEGGKNDRTGAPLYTLEMYQAGKAPYVSVAGDWQIWPYGQRISINHWPNVVFRVVDTGGNFWGAKKVYRVEGREPLDICVDSSKTFVPKKDTVVTIHPGDVLGHKTGPKAVVASRFKGQTVMTGDERGPQFAAAEAIVGAYYDALQRGL